MTGRTDGGVIRISSTPNDVLNFMKDAQRTLRDLESYVVPRDSGISIEREDLPRSKAKLKIGLKKRITKYSRN
jgi:hypothetical protein